MQNLNSNLTLWKLGTLPPALIAFRGNVHPIDPSWHMLGLGYQKNTDVESVRKAAVIHYNGQSKPWLEIAFKHLQPFWTKYVNYSNEFIRNCHIMEPWLYQLGGRRSWKGGWHGFTILQLQAFTELMMEKDKFMMRVDLVIERFPAIGLLDWVAWESCFCNIAIIVSNLRGIFLTHLCHRGVYIGLDF